MKPEVGIFDSTVVAVLDVVDDLVVLIVVVVASEVVAVDVDKVVSVVDFLLLYLGLAVVQNSRESGNV